MKLGPRSNYSYNTKRYWASLSPQKRKTSPGYFVKKKNKRDKSQVKSYRVIGFLNCLGKFLKKLILEKLSLFCEICVKLHGAK